MTDDDELLDRYTRARVKGGVMVIEVAVIKWDGQRPKMSWVEVQHLLETVSAAIAQAARRSALLDPAYFIVCRDCSRRHALGHTRDGLCHGCAAHRGGVPH